MERRVKGSLIIARMKYLRAQGEQSVEDVLGRLPEEDRKALHRMLLPSTWYPADLLTRLEATIATALSRGDGRALFLDMGRFSAQANLGPKGVQRPFLREGNPQFLLRNVPRMYTAQHALGTRTYEETGEKTAVIRTLDGPSPKPEDCLTTIGWLQRAIELSGGRDAKVTEAQCRAKGGACCEYRCSWS
jgi:uncharacterized protein (TIGR02265 family)